MAMFWHSTRNPASRFGKLNWIWTCPPVLAWANGVVAVGSADGLIIVLDAKDGTERWRVNLGGEVLAPPLITDESVIVSTIDNRLRALRSFDGTELWILEKSTPALTMRGSATPAMSGNSVIAGFDNGRLVAAAADIRRRTLGIIFGTAKRALGSGATVGH